jgi:hypothetical protein
MRKAILAALVGALTITLPQVSSANSSSSKGLAIIVCGETGAAVQVVAASVTTGLTAPAVGADCAPSIAALSTSGMKIQSVVQTGTGWVYTLSSSSSNSQNNQD